MLSIKMIGSSKQEVGYYSDLGEDYYVDGGEPPGTWWGTGAKELGLSGRVGSMDFRNILEGLSPDGSQSLVQNAKKKDRRAGFDLTFSVPKSVSIARVSADPRQAGQIDQACDKAGEEGDRAAAQALVAVRYELSEKDEPRGEFIESAMNMLF